MNGAVGQRPVEQFQLELVDDFDAARDVWTALADRTRNVFATPEWNSIWWRHFGRGRRLLITLVRSREGEPIAILPLYFWSSWPLRILRFVGHGPGDELGPICGPADRALAASALSQVLAATRWDVLLGEKLPRDSDWARLLGARILRSEGDPRIIFGGADWDELLLRSASSNTRQQLRRRERKLAQGHGLRYRLTEGQDDFRRDLDTFFGLHAARWSNGASTVLANEGFHREFAAAAFDRGWLRLWFLELEGRPVAAWYGLRYGDVESYYQAGRDPEWERESVGFLLLAHSIRAALEDGMSEYRFLGGEGDFKYRIATVDPGLETVVLARGRGRTALALRDAVGGRSSIKMALRPIRNLWP